MLTIAYYFLQVVLCSGMMMGYYWLVLRNKRFHQYNRFYLLAIALLSWIVPLIKIRWNSTSAISQEPQVMQFLSVVADNNSQIEQAIYTKGFEWDWNYLVIGMYAVVSLVLLLGMIRSLIRLYRLLQHHSCKNVGDVYLILTQAKGTPFSFFRYIFWNEEIDIRSESGKQILQHELTHVQQKHSFDKLFIQAMLIAGWFNPFFWLLRKEMDMIHEFIADKKAVNNGDTASLAQMLLTAAYPQQKFSLTHPFFFSPIKRRLQMLTNNKNPRFSYIRRLVVLPLLAIVVVLFAFRNKDQRENTTLSLSTVMENVKDEITGQGGNKAITVFDQAILNKTCTVVIDAGHGGSDKGATGLDGTTESELALALAKKIKELNGNEKINIVLTRESDTYYSVEQKAKQANDLAPDLFVSLHCNEAPGVKKASVNKPELTGIEIFVPSKEAGAYYNGSVTLANMLSGSMKGLDAKMLGIKSRKKGVYVLENVQSPAVLIETGFVDNKNDLAKLKDASYQKEMAQSILQGINNYLSVQVQHGTPVVKLNGDTIVKGAEDVKIYAQGITINKEPGRNPLIYIDGKKYEGALNTIIPDDIASIDILKNESAIANYGAEAKDGVILITTKAFKIEGPVGRSGIGGIAFKNTLANNPLIIVDGTKVSNDDLNLLNPDKIASVNVLKNESATSLYGEEGKNGVIVITTKNAPGEKYIITDTIAYGQYYPTPVRNGVIVTTTKIGQGEKNMLIDTIAPGKNDGSPAKKVNNGSVTGYGQNSWYAPRPTMRLTGYPAQVTLTKRSEPYVENVKLENIATGTNQTPATFPGGAEAWDKYLMRNLDRAIVKKNGGPPGKYTAVVSFIVDKEGNLSEIVAENDPGYGTKQEAIRIIAKGPNWVPAMLDGKKVIYRAKQKITWVVMEDNNSDQKGKGTISQTTPSENGKGIIPVSFPGGLPAWTKYLERYLSKDLPVKKGAPPGKYTVQLAFNVAEDGNVSNVRSENDPGYGIKEEAIRLIAKGPKWKPATQNGKNIPSVHRQSITWFVAEPANDVKTNNAVLEKPVNTNKDKRTAKEIEFENKLAAAKAGNQKTFFTIDGVSCVTSAGGSWAALDATTNIVIVNGKRMTPQELNAKYKRSDFVLLSASESNETIKKYGKGVLLVSSKTLTFKEMQGLLQSI